MLGQLAIVMLVMRALNIPGKGGEGWYAHAAPPTRNEHSIPKRVTRLGSNLRNTHIAGVVNAERRCRREKVQ